MRSQSIILKDVKSDSELAVIRQKEIYEKAAAIAKMEKAKLKKLEKEYAKTHNA